VKFENGCVVLPKGPGLGVELDRAALARARANFLRARLTERNDEVEMQKIPVGSSRPTRWAGA
jgi:glucarate dehydratase